MLQTTESTFDVFLAYGRSIEKTGIDGHSWDILAMEVNDEKT